MSLYYFSFFTPLTCQKAIHNFFFSFTLTFFQIFGNRDKKMPSKPHWNAPSRGYQTLVTEGNRYQHKNGINPHYSLIYVVTNFGNQFW